MPLRTVKGRQFSIILHGHRITITHVPCKGNRCRVKIPRDAYIEISDTRENDMNGGAVSSMNDSTTDEDDRIAALE